jgi:hypothetical protein
VTAAERRRRTKRRERRDDDRFRALWGAVGEIRRDVTSLRERMARIEVKLGALIVGTAILDRLFGWFTEGK